jgi:hypothetical protein
MARGFLDPGPMLMDYERQKLNTFMDPKRSSTTEIIGKKSERLKDVFFALTLVVAATLSWALAVAWIIKRGGF